MELAPIAVVEAPSATALGGANDADTDADDLDGFSAFDPAGYNLRTDAAQGTTVTDPVGATRCGRRRFIRYYDTYILHEALQLWTRGGGTRLASLTVRRPPRCGRTQDGRALKSPYPPHPHSRPRQHNTIAHPYRPQGHGIENRFMPAPPHAWLSLLVVCHLTFIARTRRDATRSGSPPTKRCSVSCPIPSHPIPPRPIRCLDLLV